MFQPFSFCYGLSMHCYCVVIQLYLLILLNLLLLQLLLHTFWLVRIIYFLIHFVFLKWIVVRHLPKHSHQLVGASTAWFWQECRGDKGVKEHSCTGLKEQVFHCQNTHISIVMHIHTILLLKLQLFQDNHIYD